jgi:hypothetical protein
MLAMGSDTACGMFIEDYESLIFLRSINLSGDLPSDCF